MIFFDNVNETLFEDQKGERPREKGEVCARFQECDPNVKARGSMFL